MLQEGLGVALLSAAMRYHDRPALWAGDETLTYRSLFERAGALASLIRELGAPPGERVAILSYRSSMGAIAKSW